jgi:uncharacterized membrane protein
MMRKRWSRALRHLFYDQRAMRRAFPGDSLARIEARVAAGETRHAGEIRVAIEDSLSLGHIWSGVGPRERAVEVFAALRVWDTEANNGVLIYLLLADHAVEILADRAAARAVGEAKWGEIADALVTACRRGDFVEGTLAAIERVDALLEAAFPVGDRNPDELPNRPALIGRRF